MYYTLCILQREFGIPKYFSHVVKLSPAFRLEKMERCSKGSKHTHEPISRFYCDELGKSKVYFSLLISLSTSTKLLFYNRSIVKSNHYIDLVSSIAPSSTKIGPKNAFASSLHTLHAHNSSPAPVVKPFL